MMLREILLFEIVYRLRRPLLYVFAVFFFILPFGAISTDSVMVGGAIGNVARNAPYVIVEMLMMMSAVGLLFLTIFVAPAVNRDNEENVQELFFSTPLTKPAYIFGRYFGSVIPVILAMFMSCAGIFLASIMPYQDPEFIQAFSAAPYIFAMTVLVIPNMMLMGAIFFSISTLTRRNFSAYVGVIVMMALWGLGAALLSDLQHQTLSALIDPFGVGAFKVVTRYWTIAERNTMLPPLTGLFLANRLLWAAIAAAIMVFTWLKYRMALPGSRGGGKAVDDETDEAPARARLSGFTATCRFDPRARLAQLWGLTRFETRSILRSIPFLIITFFGMANLFGSMLANPEGATSYPLTQHMLEMIEGAFAVMPWLVIIIYGAEIVWKDERVRIDGIVGALPVSDWIRLSAKLGALFTAMTVMAVCAFACTITYQAMNGYFDFQLSLYFKGLFLILLGQWLLLSVLSVFLQILAGNRYLGTLFMVGAFVLNEVLPETGRDHRLYLFSELPPSPWSDMNGYGHFGPAIIWFRTYWSIFAAILAVLATLLWVNGRDRRPGARLKLFAKRMTAGPAAALAVLTLAFVLTGSWIFYNTNILNEYRTSRDIRQMDADYEKT
ncbi:MAG TPA: ABC-2 transporter permease, partial [Candidatus Krumholzibacterium sp.]|nr:ABC-2 transporter permease [Candidatus Krumholzibacterium sp.]